MTFAQVQAFMKKVGTVFLATTDGRRPRVRPMSAYAWYDGELWFATGGRSAKVKDLRRRPVADICCMARASYRHVRIEATCRISRSAADKKRMFAAFPWMRNFFGSPTHPDWVVLRMTPIRIRSMGKDLEYLEVAFTSDR